jgi:hypothetical protein
VSNLKAETRSYPQNWRELDDPFYILIKDVLEGKGASGFVNQAELQPDLDFWPENPPEEIVVATGSTRKAFMLSVVLNDLRVPLEHPMDYQDFIVHSVYNGDGSLKEKTLLGEYHGVPVYAESAAAGETAGNSPKAEALNKAFWLSEQPQYKGKNVLIVSTDTVDFLDLDGNGSLSAGEEGLGKPMNHPGYPKKNKLMSSKFGIAKALGQRIFDWQVDIFNKKYIKENFLPDTFLVHTNAVALLEVLANGSDEVVRIWNAILQSTTDEEFFATYEPVPDQGGGGASQQNQNWESVEELFDSLDEETQDILRPIKEEDPDFFKFLLIFQISGMPAMNILEEIANWAEAKKAGLKPKEVVVFASE